MIQLQESYQKILEELSKGHRALMRFPNEELESLNELLVSALKKRDLQQLEQVLCLIEHSASLHPAFEPAIMGCLKQDLPDNLLIFSLNCARKHIVLSHFQRGQRLTFDFLEVLKSHLHSRSPEVVEWTLRTIEECGSQGVYFLREFDKIKPPPWKWFNSHQRAVREIVAMLERRWGKFEKH